MNLTPRLRLAEFSKAPQYTQYKFDDIFVFSSGKNIKQKEASPEFNTPCVRYGELYHMYGEVITETINRTNLGHSELTFSYGNEILLPSAGEDPLDIGSASALMLKDVAIGRTINVLRPKGDIEYSHVYVSYYINEKLRKRISKLARGASISNVYNTDLKTLKANLPELSEQQKIASFLSKVDAKIGLLSEKKDKLTEYKCGVMQQLFNGKWHEQDGQLTFAPPTLRFKADDGSEFPDWEEKTLSEVCEFRDSQRLPLSSEERQQRQGQYRYYGASGVIDYVDDFLFDGDFVLLGEDGANIITRSTPLAFVVKGKFWVNNHAHVLKAIGSTYFLAQSLELLNYEKYNSGTAQPKLNAAICKKIELIMPCDAEQTKIANFLSAIDQKIDLTNSELNKAKEWKKGLLQQMFV